MNRLKLMKCNNCKKILKIIKEDSNINCDAHCLVELIPNIQDASIEKHLPTYRIVENNLIIEIPHVMEDDHYIEWISVKTPSSEYTKYFKPKEKPTLIFPYQKDIIIYSYCNKHGLWEKEVEHDR